MSKKAIIDAIRDIFSADGSKDDEHIKKGSEVQANQPKLSTTFKYSALKEGHIRVLELLPGLKDEEIHVTLTHHQLMEKPKFEALSYCWGDVENSVIINVDGANLLIRRNLWNALLALRKEHASRLLWADAICIDQSNIVERGHQVDLMANIYATADQTIAWLGPDVANEAKTAFNWCSQLASAPNIDAKVLKAIDGSNHALDHLVNKPWWSRVWVVQEFVLSRRFVLCCGDHQLDWATFSKGLNHGLQQDVWRAYHLGLIKDTTFELYRTLNTTKLQTESLKPSDELTELLLTLRSRKATDPRDKVFALLGLLGDARHCLAIRPDYRSDVDKVYVQAAKSILSQSGNLNILGACPTHNLLDHKTQLPSWVPDWTPQGLISAPYSSPHFMDGKSYSACGDSISTPQFDGDKLNLMGHQYDTIASMANTLPELDEDQWDDLDFDQHPMVLKMAALLDRDDHGSISERVHSLGSYLKGLSQFVYLGLDAIWQRLSSIVPHLATFIEWEQFADVHDDESKDIYIHVLSAGRDGKDDGQDLKSQYKKWSQFLRPMRKLVKHGWQTRPRALRLLGFVSWLYVTWTEYPPLIPLLYHLQGRRLAKTTSGRLCLLPHNATLQDEIWIFQGGRVPLVIRRSDNKSTDYVLVGETYVHGIMDGEAFSPNLCTSVSLV